MNLLDLTPQQLKRAAAIKEQIDRLNSELVKLLGGTNNKGADHQNGRLSLATRRRIAAAQRARWAKARTAKAKKKVVTRSVAKKSKMSAASRAKASARMKAYWAAKKAGKKRSSKR